MKRSRRQHGARPRGSQPGSVRIIAGRWRGRRLPVADVPGLRPSGDRVRETLFNWLAPVLDGARCLDLFAGTGVLGLEAASRGAREVVLVERDRVAVRALEAAVDTLGATGVRVVAADARRWLAAAGDTFDVVFLDPPFASALLAEVLPLLAPVVRAGGTVYVETAASDLVACPAGFAIDRERQFGDVRAALWRRLRADEADPPG